MKRKRYLDPFDPRYSDAVQRKQSVKKDWFDEHVEIIGASESFAKQVKDRLRQELAQHFKRDKEVTDTKNEK
jgi:hypothetical protein